MTNPTEKQAPKLLDQVRDRIRVKHYSLRTEDAYLGWIKRFILFHNKRHPREMGACEIEAFLSYLATERDVSASTQNQALSAVLFLYKEVLEIQLPWLDGVTPEDAKQAARIRADLKRKGTPIGAYDLQIAATALVNGLTVVTNNTDEFKRVVGLKLENWV